MDPGAPRTQLQSESPAWPLLQGPLGHPPPPRTLGAAGVGTRSCTLLKTQPPSWCLPAPSNRAAGRPRSPRGTSLPRRCPSPTRHRGNVGPEAAAALTVLPAPDWTAAQTAPQKRRPWGAVRGPGFRTSLS